MPLDRSLISGLPAFAGLGGADLDAVLSMARSSRFAKDAEVFSQDEEAHQFFLLLSGHVRVVRTTPAGDQVIARYINEGELFGIAVAMGRTTYPASAVAAVDCVVLSWPNGAWQPLQARFPGFGTNAYQTIGTRLQETQARVVEMSTQQVEQRIATITIDRPARRNALSMAVVDALIEAIQECSDRDDVGVVVLTGAGDRVFCAGGDLMDQQSADGMLGMHEGRGKFAELMVAMQRSKRPIIARINGHALGGGFGLALGCDLVVSRDDITFGMPEVKVGLFPMMIMAVVVRNLGRKRTLEMMLTGERIGASKALEWGIINRAVPEALRTLGYTEAQIKKHIDAKSTFETFFAKAKLNPNAELIKGTICGYRIEDIETPLTREVRYLDKLVDELAKGRKMEKIRRSEG